MMLWYLFFVGISCVFLAILLKEKNVKYIFYAIAGSLYGFMFDSLGVYFEFYTYQISMIRILNIPLTLTIAEGFCIAVTIYVFEKVIIPTIGSKFNIK